MNFKSIKSKFIIILTHALKPLEKLVSYINSITDNNLANNISTSKRAEEIEQLSSAFELSLANFKNIISNININSAEVNSFFTKLPVIIIKETGSISAPVVSSIQELSASALRHSDEINKLSKLITKLDNSIDESVSNPQG